MTAVQIYALLGLIVTAALLFWLGYRSGHGDGMAAGIEEGSAVKRAENTRTIRKLKASLELLRTDHKNLAQFCKQLQTSQTFGQNERQILLDIAEKLRIAAETFSAFRTGKKLERDTTALREQSLDMAARLKPVAWEDAA